MLLHGASAEFDTLLALKPYKSLSNGVDHPEEIAGYPITALQKGLIF